MTRFQATGPRVDYTPQEGPKAGDQLIGLYNMWQSISPETRDWIAGLFKSDGEESPAATEQDNLNREMVQAESAANQGLQRGQGDLFNGQEAFDAAIDAALHASDDYKNSQQAAADASINAIDDFKKRQQAAAAAELKAQQRARGRHNLGLDWPVVVAPYPSFTKGPF